jgi:hypothetical protein
MVVDPLTLANFRQRDLQTEAARERLAAQVPRTSQTALVRRALATTCYRLAAWLEANDQIVAGSSSLAGSVMKASTN